MVLQLKVNVKYSVLTGNSVTLTRSNIFKGFLQINLGLKPCLYSIDYCCPLITTNNKEIELMLTAILRSNKMCPCSLNTRKLINTPNVVYLYLVPYHCICPHPNVEYTYWPLSQRTGRW